MKSVLSCPLFQTGFMVDKEDKPIHHQSLQLQSPKTMLGTVMQAMGAGWGNMPHATLTALIQAESGNRCV